MKIKITLTPEDYRKWNMEFFYGGFRGRLLIAISVLLVSATAFYAWKMGVKSLADNPQILFVICLGLLFLFLMPVSIFFQSKKAFLSDKFLQAEQEYEFSVAGFTVKSLYGNSDVPWAMTHRIKISKKFISIFISSIKAFVIPKRMLTDGENMELAELLKGKLKQM